MGVGVTIGPVAETTTAQGSPARSPAAAADEPSAWRAALRGSLTAAAIPGIAVLAALMLFRVFIAFTGRNPVAVYREMYRGSLGTWFSFQNTLQPADRLVPTALAAALPLRMGLVVLGGEGAMVLGGL